MSNGNRPIYVLVLQPVVPVDEDVGRDHSHVGVVVQDHIGINVAPVVTEPRLDLQPSCLLKHPRSADNIATKSSHRQPCSALLSAVDVPGGREDHLRAGRIDQAVGPFDAGGVKGRRGGERATLPVPFL